jgi:hypothetical protein
VSLYDESSGAQVFLGKTLYVHVEGTAGQLDQPPYGYNIPGGVGGGNGQWTVSQLGLIYGGTPVNGERPAGCQWTGPHLHQGAQFQIGRGLRNDALCSATYGCYIDPTNDTANKWMFKYTWSTTAPDPTPTATPTGGGGGGGK